MIRLPKMPIVVSSKILFKFLYIILNVIPLTLVEKACSLLNLKPVPLQKLLRDCFYFSTAFNFFTKDPFIFDNQNLMLLHKNMTKEDHMNFPSCFPGLHDFDSFMGDTINGIRKFNLKEDEKDLVEAKKKLKLLFIIDFLLGFIFLAGLVYLVSKFLF